MRPKSICQITLLACFLTLLALSASPALAQEMTVRTGMVPAEDGVEIAFTERGQGDPTLVFIHCWACNQEFWRDQVDVFAQNYRVVTMDLPGHGLSGRNRKNWSVAGYGQDVKSVVDALELGELVLIGHSMGGPVALAAYPLLADRTLAVIAVESLHNAEQVFPAEALEGWAKTMEADYDGMMQQMVTGMFADGGSPELRDWVIAQAIADDHQAMIALILDFANVDIKAWMADVSVPIRAVNAAPRPPAIPETMTEINQKYADFEVILLEGVGHYLILEDPDDFNALLRLQLDELLMSAE